MRYYPSFLFAVLLLSFLSGPARGEVQTYLDSFNVGTAVAGSTVKRSGYGFSPKCFLIWTSGRTESVDTVGSLSHAMAMGFGVSPTDRRTVGTHSEDAAATSDTHSHKTADAVLRVLDAAGATDGLLDVSSINADGITFVIDDQFTKNVRVHVLAFGGTSITDQVTGSTIVPTASGNQSVTGLGFQPSVVFFMVGTRAAGVGEAVQVDSSLSFGFATGATEQGTVLAAADHNQATKNTLRYSHDTECIVSLHSNFTSKTRASFVSMDADGFTINWLTTSASESAMYFMAVGGGSWKAGSLLTRTDTADIPVTGLGFQPSGVLFVSHCSTESAGTNFQDNDMISIGAATSASARAAQARSDEDNLATSEVAAAIRFDQVYVKPNLADGIDALMDLKSMDSDGFTCVMDDTEPVEGSLVLWLAAGPAPAASTDDGMFGVFE